MLKRMSLGFPSLVVVAITVFLVNTALAQEFVTDGLMGFWTLDEDTIDGNAVRDVWGDNHGEIAGGGFGKAFDVLPPKCFECSFASLVTHPV